MKRRLNFNLCNCLSVLVSVKKEQSVVQGAFLLLNKVPTLSSLFKREHLFFLYAHLDASFTQIKI